MDPITSAVVAALAAGVTASAGKVVETAIVDAYHGLKEILKRKFGDTSEVVKAVEGLEARPESLNRKGTLQEEVAAVKADQDSEALAAAHAVLERIKAMPGGEQIVQNATGSYIAQAASGSSASVNVGQP